MTPETSPFEDTRSSAEIEADIRQTRGRMDATLDELGERLTARSLLNSALDWWESPSTESRSSEAAKTAAVTVGRTLRENPMPTLLIGAGIAWLVMDRRSKEEDTYLEVRHGNRYRNRPTTWPEAEMYAGAPYFEEEEYEGPGMGERASEAAEDTKQRASELAGEAKERLQRATGRAKERISSTGDRLSGWGHERSERFGRRARRTLQRGRSATHNLAENIEEGYHAGVEHLEDAVKEYPLAIGLGCAALGALAGLLMPRTRREDELMGETSDHLMESAKHKGEELLERGKAVGERTAEAALEEARAQGITPEAASEQLSGLANKLGQVAKTAKEEARAAAEDEDITPSALKHKAEQASASTVPDQSAKPTGPPPMPPGSRPL